MTSTRVITAVTVAVLGCLIAVAVALSTGPSSAPIVPTHLEVGSGPPSTVTGTLRYSDGSGISIAATVAINVPAGTAQLAATATLSVVTASVTLRTVGDDAYLLVPGYASLLGAQWTEVRAPRDDHALSFLVAELRRPDLARLHATSTRTSRAAGGITTTLRFQRATVPQLEGLPIDLPRHGHLVLSVRQGPAGQVLAMALHLWTQTDSVRLSFVVTGYDQPVTLAAPPRSAVEVLDRARATKIFGTNTPMLERTLASFGIRVGEG